MRVLLLIAALLIGLYGTAQYYFYNDKFYESDWVWDVGISPGIMNCLTDLGGKKGKGKPFLKDLNWKNTKLSVGVHTNFLYHHTIGIRIGIIFGKITSCDSILKNDHTEARTRYQRNLHFRSNITELSILTEFHPASLWDQKNNSETSLFSFYLLAGIGYFHFNPEANFKDNWIPLHSLHTEGQGFGEFPERKNYELWQVNFPLGAGLQFEISALLSARLEVIHRFLQTDYLDDVSNNYIDPNYFSRYLNPQNAVLAKNLADRRNELNPGNITNEGEIRGDPKNKDAYFSAQLVVSLILNRTRRK